jgi:hypothetical protein
VIAAYLDGLEAATSTKRACELLGAARATDYRRRNPPPNNLAEANRQRVLSVLRSAE